MELLKSGFYFLTVLSVLVLVHEWGHYIVAKMCGMRVEDFSLFFGPRLIRLGVRNGTEYNIRAIPLGGYVKVAGMEPDDISNGASLYRRDPKERRFAKTLRGLDYEAMERDINWDNVSERIEMAVYNAVDDGSLTREGEAEIATLSESTNLTEDERHYLNLAIAAGKYVPDPNGYNQKPAWQRAAMIFAGPFLSLSFGYLLIVVMGVTSGLPVALPPDNVIDQIIKDKPADRVGLKHGDRIVKINSTPITTGEQMIDMIHANGGHELVLEVKRDDTLLAPIHVTPELSDEPVEFKEDGKTVKRRVGQIGFMALFPVTYERYGPLGAIRAGTEMIKAQVVGTFTVLTHPKTAAGNMGGIVKIAGIIHEDSKSGPTRVAFTAAVISISLGIMNLLPIPVLDGGHLMLLAFEAIRRRRLSGREIYTAQMVGLSIIAVLFVFVMYNDIRGLLPSRHKPAAAAVSQENKK